MAKQTLSTRIKPLFDRVVGRKLEEKLKAGSIILPDSAKKEQQFIKIIAVGPGRKDKEGKVTPAPVKEGDVVLLEKYAGQEITLDDEEFVVAKADEIVAIIEQ